MVDPGVVAFYDRHPISAAQILDKILASRGSVEGLTAADLFAHDQDHYGGLAANDALAAAAGVASDSHVLDMCAGLCGPARYNATRSGCRVVGLELNASRCAGARDLNRRTGLDGPVTVVRGDVTKAPFGSGTFDVVWSQEAFLHVPDKPALLASARRVLKPGGRLAFTDWVAGPSLTADDRALMHEGIAALSIVAPADYVAALRTAGFAAVETTDVSADWIPILKARLEMYRGLREDARRASGADPHADYVRFYERFVALVDSGELGGGRFIARA